MKLVFLGAPGAGKGTQAEILGKKLGIPAISTGNILREAIKNGTETGAKAKSYIDAGQLVPDDIVVAALKDRMAEPDCKAGYILDGFPRNIAQAETLEKLGVKIDLAVSFELADDVIERRMTGRRVCSGCGSTYHIEHNPPASEGVCDKCKGGLSQRADDAPATVRERLAVFHEVTEPIKGFYEKAGILKLVVVQEGVDATSKTMFDVLGLN